MKKKLLSIAIIIWPVLVFSQVYFEEIPNSGLPAVTAGANAVGDLDKDGDLDIFLTGFDGTGPPIAKIYLNDGNGVFTEDTINIFEGVYDSAVDIEENGVFRPNIMYSGKKADGTALIKYYTPGNPGYDEIPLNDPDQFGIQNTSNGSIAFGVPTGNGGGSQFVVVTGDEHCGLFIKNGEHEGVVYDFFKGFWLCLTRSDAVFEDYDNDGDQDLVYAGLRWNGNPFIEFFQNSGLGDVPLGNFNPDSDLDVTISDFPIEQLYNASIDLADFDDDGILDLVYSGINSSGVFKTNLYLQKYINAPGEYIDGFRKFVLSENTFTGVDGNVEATDLDGNGTIDLLVTGLDNNNQTIAKIYLDAGSPNYTEYLCSPLEGVFYNNLEMLVDVDGDGDKDIIVNGTDQSGNLTSKIYRTMLPNESAQRSALMDLYNATGGPSWTNKDNWGSNLPLDCWFGVTATSGNVTAVDLNNNNLVGSIPSSLSNLTELENLDIRMNAVTSISTNGLVKLKTLNIGGNSLNSLNVTSNTALQHLWCYDNNLSNLDLTNNLALIKLQCDNNNLNELNLANNTTLKELYCNGNNYTELDLSNNLALEVLWARATNLIAIDVSNNSNLRSLRVQLNNQLTSLNVANGNNTNLYNTLYDYHDFASDSTPNLFCITVDDVAYSTANWTSIDPQDTFSEDCTAETDFISFSLPEQTSEASIDSVNHTIDIEVGKGTTITSLTASFQLFFGSTVSVGGAVQENGVTANDFSAPVTYTVTAANGTTTQDWLVTVTESPYCASKGNNTDFFYIGQVELGSIDNSSQAGTGGYQDFTSESTDLYKGSQNTITITPTFSSTIYLNGYAVWIDYNQDGDFEDAGEFVASQSATTNLSIQLPFTAETSALPGLTRMRVSMRFNGIPTSCESFDYGEVEDYSINIIDGLSPESQVWQVSNTPQPDLIEDISVVNNNVIWIKDQSNDNNGISISNDGGLTWVHKDYPALFTDNSFSIGVLSAVDANTAYIVVSSAQQTSLRGIYKTTDAGDSWVREPGVFTDNSFPDMVHFWDSNHGFAMGDGLEVYSYLNGVWTNITTSLPNTSYLYSFNSSDYLRIVGSSAYFLTNTGTIFKSADMGSSWEEIITPFTSISNLSFDFKDELNGVLIFNNNSTSEIYSTSNGGQTWGFLGSNISNAYNKVKYIPSLNKYISASKNPANFGISYSDDDGLTWKIDHEFNSLYSNYIGEIEYAPNGTVFLGGFKYVFYRDPNVKIPDPAFEQALIDLGIDSDGSVNGQVLESDVATITTLDISSKNISDLAGISGFRELSTLNCSNNQIVNLSLINNKELTSLNCSNNQLEDLNLKNGYNTTISSLDSTNNPNLTCIQVDDAAWSASNWTNIDTQSYFSEYCGPPLTFITDQNFELALIDLGIDSDGIINGQVLTSDVSSLTILDVSGKNINDLTGIEDFVSLTTLYCWQNNLSSLNLANNSDLIELQCWDNALTSLNVDDNVSLSKLVCMNNNINSLDLSNNLELTELFCFSNNLTSLILDNNSSLTTLWCNNNNLTSLDLSSNVALTTLYCGDNNLNSLSFKNGNNVNITEFAASGNPNLTCITVDDATYSNANWTNIDPQTSFSEDCSAETDFISFSLPEQTGEATIDPVNHTIDIEVIKGTPITSLTASFQLIFGATVSVGAVVQQSGVTANDFSAPVTYMVTAANGTTTQDWLVTVTEAPYCISNSIDPSYEYIGRVQLGTIDNTSQAGSGGYQDFTSISTDLYRGSVESVFVTPTFPFGPYQEGYAVWIDYNQDGDFEDEGELIFSVAPTADLLIELPFVVDANALPGLTRMRVSQKWLGVPTPCETFDAGEVEDYTINIVDGLSPATGIVDFVLTGQVSETLIDEVNHTIDISISDAIDISNLTAFFTLANTGAMAAISGTPQQSGTTVNDFSAPVTYTITAEDGVTTQDWIVNVTQQNVVITLIPDANFEQALIDLGIDSIGVLNGSVLNSDVSSLTTLIVDSKNISDLTGIGDFVSLTTLDVGFNNITSLNVDNLTSLSNLYCWNNDINTLNVDNNTSLTELYCGNNNFNTLNVANNTALTVLRCNGNNLSSLNLVNNSALTYIYVSNNNLSSLNVKNGNNVNVTLFEARSNPSLTCVQVDDATYSNVNWTNIDPQTSFSEDCSSNLITLIPDQNFEQALIDLGIDSDGVVNSQVLTSDVSLLTSLNVANKNINDLTGIEDFVSLTSLSCQSNNLSSLNVNNNVVLEYLAVSNNLLTSLDLSSNSTLQSLTAANNSLTSLDVTSNAALFELTCQNNQLTSLNTPASSSLTILGCYDNQLTELDVSANTALTLLYCDGNQLVSLDLSLNTALNNFRCQTNQLSRLNVKNGNNTNFTQFNATGNTQLECIQVDNSTWSTTNWTNIDAQTSFSENCEGVWEVYIPDTTLATAIVTNYLNVIDTNGDGKITFAEASAYTGTLDLSNQGITDVTGLQAFTGVTEIDLSGNSITDLSVLIESDAVILSRMQQELKSVARAIFTGLTTLNCSNNLLTSLDVSSITTLTSLDCSNNPLEILNVKNGNNSQFTNFSSLNNPNLYCVQVDDSAYANTNWTNRDSQTEFNDIACYARLLSKVFFQGPYDTNSGLMIDVLRSGGLIPTTSPYIDALTIDASVLTVTGNDAIIDWIWVELRDKTNQTTVVASQSALLQADGDVVNTDGVKPLVFDGAIDDYYIVLSHRNHLGVLTAGTFNLEEGVVNLDLKSDSNFVFGGTNAIKDMGNGSFALFAGDFNGDGQVQNTDKNAVEPLRGISGYSNADIDMNGEVQNSDLNSVLNPNIGKGQQFMSKELNAKRKKSIK